MNIWLLAGYAGSGKTTAAEYFQSQLPYSKMTAFAKRVKDDVSVQYGLDRSLLETQEGKAYIVPGFNKTVRECLIEHSANHKLQTNNPGIWALYVKDEIERVPEISNWILHDWRYLAEYSMLHKIPNAKLHTVRILKSAIKPSESASEHELDFTETEYVIQNDGSLQELSDSVKRIIDKGRI